MSIAGIAPKLASLGKSVFGIAKTAPIASGIAGVGSVGLLASDLLKPFAKRATDPLGKQITGTFQERAAALADRAKARRLSAAMRENEARLAAMTPDLYAMLVAGERLPIGGRTFGGVPQRDLVNAVTARMSTGGFTEQTAEDDLRDLLTG